MSSSILAHRWLRVTLSGRTIQIRSMRLWSGHGGRKWSLILLGWHRLQQSELLAVGWMP